MQLHKPPGQHTGVPTKQAGLGSGQPEELLEEFPELPLDDFDEEELPELPPEELFDEEFPEVLLPPLELPPLLEEEDFLQTFFIVRKSKLQLHTGPGQQTGSPTKQAGLGSGQPEELLEEFPELPLEEWLDDEFPELPEDE